MSGPMVMRPKSIATVVPVLPSTAPTLSTPRPSTVISASVRSGSISEMAPTKVVLPTAKPPATTIFIATGTDRARAFAAKPDCARRSESADSIKQPLEQRDIVGRVLGTDVDGHRVRGHQIPYEHARDTHREQETRRDLGDRQRLVAQVDDATRFGGGRARHRAGGDQRSHLCLQREG